MKKLVSIVLIFMIMFCVAACGDSASEKDVDTSKVKNSESTSAEKSSVTETSATKEISTTAAPTETEVKKELTGFKILLDAGHGCSKTYTEQVAPDSDKTTVESPYTGATGISTKKHESILTLDIALKLRKTLEKLGATVYMVRTGKTTEMSLRQRAEMGNELKVDLVLRIHADGLDDSSVRGASLLYPSNEYIDEKIYKTSINAAECILEEYIKATKLNNRGTVERNDLVGFNFTTVPSVLIELGFMSNPEEDKLMFNKDFQNKMAQGITNGLIKFYKKS